MRLRCRYLIGNKLATGAIGYDAIPSRRGTGWGYMGMRSRLIVGGLLALLAGCDANQGEVAALRAQLVQSRAELQAYKQSTSGELAALRDRVSQLEARPARPAEAATKN